MSRLKILLVNDHSYLAGGAEVIVRRLRDGLSARGHEVRVLGGFIPGSPNTLADYTYRSFADTEARRFGLFFYNPSAIGALKKTLAEFDPDIVHLHRVGKASPFLLRALSGRAVVLSVHDLTAINPVQLAQMDEIAPYRHTLRGYLTTRGSLREAGERVRLWATKRNASSIREVLACSDFMRTLVLRSGLYGNAVTTIYNGIDPMAAQPPSEGERILYVGRLERGKGAEHLIRALPTVVERHSGASLDIIGSGSLEPALREMVGALGLGAHVQFHGFVLPAQIASFYRQAAVVAVPSDGPEAFGLTAAEAMSAGRAVVAARSGGLEEVVQHGKTGLLVPPGRPDILALALTRLLSDPALRHRMEEAAREQALAAFSTDAFIEATLAAYRDVLRQKTSAPVPSRN